MTATLTSLRDRVEVILADATNAIWVESALAEAIQRALDHYTKERPHHNIALIDITSAGYEVDLSSLTNILKVTEVWCDFTPTDPEDPPNQRSFEYWADAKILRVKSYKPQLGDVMRVFYTKPHTLNGLNAETVTTIPPDDESTIALGAAAYAATSRAVDLTEQVTLDRTTAAQIRAWGLAAMQQFTSSVKRVATRKALEQSAIIEQSALDRWEGPWA